MLAKNQLTKKQREATKNLGRLPMKHFGILIIILLAPPLMKPMSRH